MKLQICVLSNPCISLINGGVVKLQICVLNNPCIGLIKGVS